MARKHHSTESKAKPDFLPAHNGTALSKINDRFARCQQVIDMLHADGDDPLLLLWRIAQSNEVDPRLRVDCAKEVAGYLHSKQSSVKVTGDAAAPVRFNVTWDQPPSEPEQIAVESVVLTGLHHVDEAEVIDPEEG